MIVKNLGLTVAEEGNAAGPEDVLGPGARVAHAGFRRLRMLPPQRQQRDADGLGVSPIELLVDILVESRRVGERFGQRAPAPFGRRSLGIQEIPCQQSQLDDHEALRARLPCKGLELAALVLEQLLPDPLSRILAQFAPLDRRFDRIGDLVPEERFELVGVTDGIALEAREQARKQDTVEQGCVDEGLPFAAAFETREDRREIDRGEVAGEVRP